MIVTGDLAVMPAELRARRFDHVIANPPYFQRENGTGATNVGRETALGEGTALGVWIDAALRRLAPRGHLTLIHRADRLPDVLTACDDRVGDVRVLPLVSRPGRPADRVIVRARKGARGGFALLSPVVIHDGQRHDGDRDSYAAPIAAILRDGAGFSVDWG